MSKTDLPPCPICGNPAGHEPGYMRAWCTNNDCRLTKAGPCYLSKRTWETLADPNGLRAKVGRTIDQWRSDSSAARQQANSMKPGPRGERLLGMSDITEDHVRRLEDVLQGHERDDPCSIHRELRVIQDLKQELREDGRRE